MIESWRWFGPDDAVTLPEIAQAGATGIVTALHDIPYGVVWTSEAIAARQGRIAGADCGLDWLVVESLPIHEDIKLGTGDLAPLFGNYRQSLANLAAAGVSTVCYNFMPLLDWARTDLDHPQRGGARGLRFSAVRMAAYDVCLLQRPGAEADHTPVVVAAARDWAATATEADKTGLHNVIMAGLPGAFPRYTIPELRAALRRYDGIDRQALRANFARFLAEVVPAAADLGIRLCVHPDDPPRPVLGLDRIVSSGDDVAWILAAQDHPANGLTLCSGSLGAGQLNDVPAIAARFADRIHFAHLRNVAHEPDGSFSEAPHLGGQVDMVAVIATLLAEEQHRRAAGRPDAAIPFRPDHGHQIGPDMDRATHPGYPYIGRLRGLAEIRGVIAGLSHGSAA